MRKVNLYVLSNEELFDEIDTLYLLELELNIDYYNELKEEIKKRMEPNK